MTGFCSASLEPLGRVSRYAAMLVLTEPGISIAPILAAAGVLGVAVGFGAQSLVKDYFSGLFLPLEDQTRHGDVVEAGGKSGVVEEVTLRYVRRRGYDGNVHFVPNGQIATVTNMARDFSYALADIGVAYRRHRNSLPHLTLYAGQLKHGAAPPFPIGRVRAAGAQASP
jgi:hypothetical protein